MSIQKELDLIKNAVYGKEVRGAIHDGIKKAYDDAAKNGNANMEVEMARGKYPTLNGRLENLDQDTFSLNRQLDEKVSKGTKANLEDLSPSVLAAIDGTGGPFNLLSIPQDYSVTVEKTAPEAGLNMYPFHKKATLSVNKTFSKQLIDAIKDVQLFGADKTDEYRISVLKSGHYSLERYNWEVSIKNRADVEVCRFFRMSPTDAQESSFTKEEALLERNNSGITGTIIINWNVLGVNFNQSNLTYNQTGLYIRTYSSNLNSVLTSENKEWGI